MKTAISVDLGDASYSLDQDAFLTLHAYLDRAAERLGEHPDRDEVLAGLERSIGAKLARGGERSAADRRGRDGRHAARSRQGRRASTRPRACRRTRSPTSIPTRTRITIAIPRRTLFRMPTAHGRVGSTGSTTARRSRASAPGLAAYADLDVGLVRALVVLAAFFTGFFLVAALYVGLMFLVPLARTSTEIAAAHGALRSAQRT